MLPPARLPNGRASASDARVPQYQEQGYVVCVCVCLFVAR